MKVIDEIKKANEDLLKRKYKHDVQPGSDVLKSKYKDSSVDRNKEFLNRKYTSRK